MIGAWDRFAQAILDRLERAEGPDVAADPSSERTHGADRLFELDGIRGWAALAVVAFHVFYECFGAIFPAFRNPLTKTFNGSFAVYVFFVLSGEALSASCFAGGGARAVAALAVKRHSRLSIPIFASIVSLWLLQRLGLVFSAAAAPIVQRPDWLGTFAATPLSLVDCAKYAVMGVYLTKDASRQLIPFLWTMSAEMVGSIFVLALLLVWRLPLFEARFHAAAAIALVGAIFVNRSATGFFRTRLSRLPGKLPFPIYLIHLAVIVSFTSGMIVRYAATGALDRGAALGIGLASMMVALLAAAAFEPVELLTKRVGHWLSATFVAARAR